MIARGGEAEGCARTAVLVGRRIHFRSGVKQRARDFNDVPGGFLPKILDAIRRYIMNERRSVGATRTRPEQLGMRDEQPVKGREIARDNRVSRQFKISYRGMNPRCRLDMCDEFRPAFEAMLTRDDPLRVREHECSGLSFGEFFEAGMEFSDPSNCGGGPAIL